MADKVDALAILDDVIADMGDLPGTQGHQVAQVRDAVAEMIEADKEYDAAKGAHRAARNKPWEGNVATTAARLTAAWTRRAAAFANVAGGAA